MNISETVSKQEIRPEGEKSIPNHCQHSLHEKVYLFDKGIEGFRKRHCGMGKKERKWQTTQKGFVNLV